MSSTAREIYNQTVRALPPTERLQLAALILDDLAKPSLQVVEVSDDWTSEDQRNVTEASLGYASEIYPEEDDLV